MLAAMPPAVSPAATMLAAAVRATVAGMLPLAFGLGAGSQMLQPLAISVIGGLLSSMVFSLVFTPAIHYFMGHSDAVKESGA